MIYKVVIEGKFYGNHTVAGWNDRISSSAKHPVVGGKMERNFVNICADAIRFQLRGVEIKTPIAIRYVFYESDKRRDLGNIAYVDKPFCDALQRCGYIPNDGQKDIHKLIFELEQIDKDNPRIEVYIEEVSEQR